MWPTKYFPEPYCAGRYFLPSAPARGSKTVPLPAAVPADRGVSSKLQLIRPVRMVPILVVPEATPVHREHVSPITTQLTGYRTIEYTITSPYRASTEVLLQFDARARLLGPQDYFTIELLVNLESGVAKISVGRVFEISGHDCPSGLPDHDELSVSAADWNDLLGQAIDGEVRVRMRSTYLTPCAESFIRCTVSYEDQPAEVNEPPFTIWRSEEPVLLPDGRTDYLEAEWQFDPLHGAFVVVTSSARLFKTTLSGLNVAFEEDGAAYLCSETTYEVRGVVVGFSSAGECSQTPIP